MLRGAGFSQGVKKTSQRNILADRDCRKRTGTRKIVRSWTKKETNKRDRSKNLRRHAPRLNSKGEPLDLRRKGGGKRSTLKQEVGKNVVRREEGTSSGSPPREWKDRNERFWDRGTLGLAASRSDHGLCM